MRYSLNRFRSFFEFNHRYLRLNTLPLIAELEPTNICNLNCGFCDRKGIGKQGLGTMDFPHFVSIVSVLHKQMVHTRLFLHGESLLNPDFVKMVKYLNDFYRKENVKSIGFTTNGTLLTKDLFKQLIDAGLDNIEFSFEGTTKETYESLRIGAKYETMKQNILDACKLNYELGCPVNIGINIIDCKQTRPDLEKFKEEWKNTPGLNRIDVGVLGDWAGELNVDAYKTDDKEAYVSVCSAPWFFCSILYNSNVVPCCKLRNVVMGNVLHQSLDEIWNGQKYQQFRKDMLKGREHHPYCKNCKSNLFSEGSPYLVNPNKLYPFASSFLKQIQIYNKLSKNKKYTPLKESYGNS